MKSVIFSCKCIINKQLWSSLGRKRGIIAQLKIKNSLKNKVVFSSEEMKKT